jgi:Zn-finger nucleic acid-binding protein
MRKCPDCRQPMTADRRGDIAVDVCKACAGIWLDEGELRQVMQSDPLGLISLEESHAPEVAPLAAATRLRRCPDCDRGLDRYRYLYDSPVQLDLCAACGGVWVEDGELEKIHEWLEGTRIGSAGVGRRWTPEQERRLALAIAPHERDMGRLRMLCGLFTAVGRMRGRSGV